MIFIAHQLIEPTNLYCGKGFPHSFPQANTEATVTNGYHHGGLLPIKIFFHIFMLQRVPLVKMKCAVFVPWGSFFKFGMGRFFSSANRGPGGGTEKLKFSQRRS
ncbi:hypothetical protein, unlikely [Trypanosoma congolense IL3000]|uniref:Uncharacterized protein n=1 Tax=Trypanosoma congolense (strain IL3000) TaxID=1068625 RepID=F9W445_TRYCI|nr:hypothetical protein, unlikely [Trypanosoma congolense IL3000]